MAAAELSRQDNHVRQAMERTKSFRRLRMATMAVIMTLLPWTPQALAQNDFPYPGSVAHWGLGNYPDAVVDVDQDGLQDVILYEGFTSTGNIETIRYRRPDGTYVLGGTLPIGGSIGFFDATGDGIPDIVGLTPDLSSLVVVTGTGTQAMGEPIITPVPNPSLVWSSAVGDVDGDGKPDVLLGSYYSQNDCKCVRLFRSVGTGTFDELPSVMLGSTISDLLVADFNGDGTADIFGLVGPSTTTRKAAFAAGLGGGAFAPPVVHALDFTASYAHARDVDADGLPEVIVASSSSSAASAIAFLKLDGAGLFQVTEQITINPVDPYPYIIFGPWLVVEDLDGDGIDDILATGGFVAEGVNNGAYFLKGLPGGGFEPPAFSDIPDSSLIVDAVDMDLDGRPDAVLTSFGLGFLRGHGDGTFELPGRVNVGGAQHDVATGDLDRDGHADLVVALADVSGRLVVLFGDGHGAFREGPSLDAAFEVTRVIAVDITRDGVDDLLAANPMSPQSVSVFVGAGDGTFHAPIGTNAGGFSDLVVTDLNQDGFPDLVTCSDIEPFVRVFKGNGMGSFASPTVFPAGGTCSSLAVGDLYEDGRPDLVVTLPNSKSIALLQATSQGFLLPPVPTPVNLTPRCATIADVDGDSHADVAVVGYEQVGPYLYYGSSVFHGNGLGSLSPGSPSGFSGSINGKVQAADLDRDGRSELLTIFATGASTNPYPYESIGIASRRPDGSAYRLFGVLTAKEPRAIAVADFDGDGLPDVVVASGMEDDLTIALSRADEWMTLGWATPGPAGVPWLEGAGQPHPEEPVRITVSNTAGPSFGLLLVGLTANYTPFQGGLLVPEPDVLLGIASGVPLVSRWPDGLVPQTPIFLQAWFSSPGGATASNALVVVSQ